MCESVGAGCRSLPPAKSLLIVGYVWFALRLSLATGSAVSAEEPAFDTFSIRGRIVWLNDALRQRFAIVVAPEAQQQALALETRDGQLYIIAEDVRGHALRLDERLRNVPDCELLVRQYRGSPVVQIIRMFEISQGKKFELDYYCDVCAITMFELKACDCCQGPIRLRRRLVTEPNGVFEK